jgi:RNA polymerase sigma factor, TIGR02999 family
MHEITELLKDWNNGDTQALEKLIPLVDQELRKIAHSYMRKEKPGHILQTTALVHEALMKLIRKNVSVDNRKQFYALVAKRMRDVLVDCARRRPKAEHVELDEAIIGDEKPKELLMLNDALTKLATISERQVTVVECRYFIGLTLKEIAELLDISPATVDRDWRFARAWLKTQMTGQAEPGNA